MFEFTKKHKSVFNVITIIIPVITGTIGALAAAAQIWISSFPGGNLPQVKSSTVSELRAELQVRRSVLREELEHIDELLADIVRAEAAFKGVSVGQLTQPKDFFLIPEFCTKLSILNG